MENTGLEKKLSDEPIVIPGSPFWDVFKRFGRDEAIAMVVNVLGTAGMSYLLNNVFSGKISKGISDVIASLTGPVVEKVGFFPAHFKEAYSQWKEAPEKERKNLSEYFMNAVKCGSKSLAEDILVHDPMYITMMYAGLQIYPQSPAWLLSFASFVSAVFGVAALEVGVNEARFLKYKHSLKRAGFGSESYLESRFYIDAKMDPDEILKSCQKEFNLGEPRKWIYTDKYYKNKLPQYSNRTPKLRLRRRQSGNDSVQTVQIVYTRANELAGKNPEQFRFFPTKKEKLYFLLDQQMPESIEEIQNDKARRKIENAAAAGNKCDEIVFERTVANNPGTILVSADRVQLKRPFYIVEVKAYDKKHLIPAMRHIMRGFPVLQTTHSKLELAAMNGC